MFWRKKQVVPAPVGGSPIATGEISPPTAKIEVVKPKGIKLPGPKGLDVQVGGYLITALKQNPDWVWQLKSVQRPRADGKNRFDVRIFDESRASEKKVKVRDYTSLDAYPGLVLFAGVFDKNTNKVELEARKKLKLSPAS